MRTLEPIDLDFFATAPFRVSETLHLRASPDAVFAAFADAPMWTRWWPLMHEARWTKGTGGVGDERSVSLRLLGRFDERDRIEGESLEFHLRVRERYLAMAAADPNHYLVIDARADRDEIARQVRDRVAPLLSQAVRR